MQTLISSDDNANIVLLPDGDKQGLRRRGRHDRHTGTSGERPEQSGRTARGRPIRSRCARSRAASAILSLFDVDHREWTIDEIAARTGLLRMTAYRMVRTLEAAEFLVRDTTSNHYHLGPAAITMAYVAEDYSEFVEHARPFLEELLARTGESVTLAVPVDGVPVCVSIVNSPRPFQREIAPGRIIGDLASVHGKLVHGIRRPGAARRRARAEAPHAHAAHRHRPRRAQTRARARRGGGRGLRRRGPVPQHLLRRVRPCATSSATSWPRSPWSCRPAGSARESETSAPARSKRWRPLCPPTSAGLRPTIVRLNRLTPLRRALPPWRKDSDRYEWRLAEESGREPGQDRPQGSVPGRPPRWHRRGHGRRQGRQDRAHPAVRLRLEVRRRELPPLEARAQRRRRWSRACGRARRPT